MLVTIGETVAEVSDDGRDIEFLAPPQTGRVFVLPFHGAPRAGHALASASTLTPPPAADTPVPSTARDERASVGLVCCAIVAAIAMKRFAMAKPREEAPSPESSPILELDDAAFLKRFGSPT